MFIFQNLFGALADVLHLALTIYMYLVIARAVLSWIQHDPYNQIIRFIYQVTDPVLNWVRGIIPPISGLDLSPIIVVFAIIFLDRFIVTTLRYLAAH